MSYKCRAGLMVPTVLRYNGFFYGFTHRILEKTRDPFRDGDSSLLYAAVQLSADWRECIADHKHAVVRYREELAQDLYEHCKDLIERGREFEHELHVEELELRLQSMINRMMSVTPQTDRDHGDEAAGSGEGGGSKRDEGSGPEERRGQGRGIRFRFDSIPVIALCVEDADQLVVKVNKNDPEVIRAMEHPINSWGLVTHVMAAVTHHLQAQYLLRGEAALKRYMPGIARKVKPGMEPN